MAVVATDQCTLAVSVDVESVQTWYMQVAASASAPAKPTVADPTSLGWTTAEPGFDAANSKKLYTCQKTTLTDGTFMWGAVQLSSSYTGASTALNTANAAATAASNAEKVATNYITALSGNGIWVTPDDAKPNSSGAAVSGTTSGWHISDAIELFRLGVSHIKMWVENSVAKLRLGAANSTHVLIDNDSLDIIDGNGRVSSTFGESSATIGRSTAQHMTVDSNGFKLLNGVGMSIAELTNDGVLFGNYSGNILNSSVTLSPFTTTVQRTWGGASETTGVAGYSVESAGGNTVDGANGRNSLPLFLSTMFVQASNALFDAVDVNLAMSAKTIEAGTSIGVHRNLNDAAYSFTVGNNGVVTLGTNTEAEENGIKLKGGGTRNGWVLRTISAADGNGDAVLLGDGGMTIIGGGEAAANLWTALGIAAGNERLYLASDNSVYVTPNCGTVANRYTWEFNTAGNLQGPAGGAYVANNGQFYTDSDDLTSGTHPSSETAGKGVIFRDSADNIIGVIQPRFGTSSQAWQALRLYAQRSISGTAKYNILDLRIDDDGNQVVYTNNAAAWRSALGLGTAATHADTDYADATHSHSEYFSSTVNRTANTVLAAPNGSAGHASFRRLAMADLVSSFHHNTSHANIPVVTTAPTAVNTSNWNYEVYSDGEVHAWGTFMRTVALTTKLGDGFYWNSTPLYLALPVKAKFIQSVNYSMSLGGSGGAGAYCMPGGSAHTVWSGATFYLPFYIARPVSTASQSYWFSVDVWYMKA